MNLKSLFTACGSMVLVLLMLNPAWAEVEAGQITAEGTVEAGGITEPVPYNDVAKYQEYRDLAQQLIVPQLRLLLGDKGQDYYARFDAVNASQKNQMYTLRFGEYGKLDVQMQWFEIPHYFSDQVASTAYHESGGDFTLLSKPASVAGLSSWLKANDKPFDMSLLEGIANVYIRYTPTPSWTLSANLNYQNPTGEQPFGGSFLFGANPGSYKVNELWVPTQYYTYNFGTGVEYAKNGWLLGFQYQGSFFQNVYDTLIWDNPLNLTGVGSACTDSTVFSSTSTTGPCRGRAAMYPDNQAHNFIVTGAGQLPFNTHVMGSLEYGFWLQNSPFIPLTINSALQQSLSSVGARSSLGGDVRPFFANLTISSNPIKPLELKATYSYFDYDNQTRPLTFSNVKAIDDVSSPFTATAYPFAFSEQDITLEPTYRVTETLAAHLIGRISTYHNGGLEVLQQDQTSYGPAIDWTPYAWLNFRADYQHAHRSSPGYNNNRANLVEILGGTPGQIEELQGLRRFDEATLDANQTSLYASVQPIENLTLFAAFDYDDYNYPASDFGLQHTSNYSPSLGASWDPLPGVHLFSDYSWQAYDWNLRSLDEASLPAPTPPPGKTSVWTAMGRNQGNSIDFGMDIAIPQNPILMRPSHLKLQYTYTVGNALAHQVGDTAAATPAMNYPDTGTQFHELLVQYEYDLRDNFAVNVGYYFTHFGEYNFMVDNMANFMPSASANSTFLGNTVIDPYNANVGYITFKYKF